MKELIKMMVEQALDELLEPQEPTVYFDMDGVLANFEGKVMDNPEANAAKSKLDAFLASDPELADLHFDDLKAALKGEQTDPKLKIAKKLYKTYEDLMYKTASQLGHFRDLDPFPGIVDMIKAAARLAGKKPHILTAPMNRHPECEKEKIEWVKKHGLDKITDQFHCTKEKEAFAHSKWDILIDDRPKYINRFRAAGGTGILHTDSASSIEQLEKVIADLKGMNEINAIGVGGGALQSSGKISGTGGNPLGRDMSKDHERMWSGDEEDSDRIKKEERIGSRGSVDYFQMGSSLPDHLYNLDNKGRATRDPGLGGNTDKKKKNKREKKKKDTDRPGKRWYEK